MLLARRLLRLGLVLLLAATLLGASAFAILYWMIVPSLPSVETLREVQLQVPLSVYSEEGLLVAQFGDKRRYPTQIEDVPEVVKQAFIATEDARFYEHPGIDWRGISRAVWLLATTSDRRVPGGSTITQQVAKMFFLSPEYSYSRKLTEIFLALKMEKELSKDEILALYLNKSFFGNRAYGVVAAAEFYYGKTLSELTLEEAAMLASIPKFPSSGNPVVNPRRAMVRRNHVLGRMLDEGFIDQTAYERARAEPDRAHPHEPPIELEAPWVAEMVRQEVVARFGEQAMNDDGFRVFTTLQARAQEAANQATRSGLLDYDRRHGWRGTEARVDLPEGEGPQVWTALLRDFRPVVGLLPAVVLETHAEAATLGLADGQTIDLPLARMKWAQPYLSPNSRGPAPRQPSDLLSRGDIVRVARDAEGEWDLTQIPKVQGTLVAIDAEDGAIRAMTGGFSFGLSIFNRATQTARQPGSSFKPFVYAAAFERGFTPASIVLDAPVVYDDRGSGQRWSPKNDNATFSGPMRLREAMVSSRNLVSVRILDAIGVPFARRYIQQFGFAPESLPDGPSLALGTSSAPPLAMARGYATFANGGFLVEPWFIQRIEDRDGQVLFEATPARACARCPERLAEQRTAAGSSTDDFDLGSSAAAVPVSLAAESDDVAADPTLAPRAIDERTAYLIHSLLLDGVKRGTGRRAAALGRGDIGGKTGTTNDSRDAWFSGFGGPLVVSAWVGMDDFSTLGSREFGNTAALPIWIDFMRAALDGVPEHRVEMPEGIATALIDRDSGRLAAGGGNGSLAELFKVEDLRRLELRREAAGEEADKEAFDIF
jgi:penicillin-binding protein 1A